MHLNITSDTMYPGKPVTVITTVPYIDNPRDNQLFIYFIDEIVRRLLIIYTDVVYKNPRAHLEQIGGAIESLLYDDPLDEVYLLWEECEREYKEVRSDQWFSPETINSTLFMQYEQSSDKFITAYGEVYESVHRVIWRHCVTVIHLMLRNGFRLYKRHCVIQKNSLYIIMDILTQEAAHYYEDSSQDSYTLYPIRSRGTVNAYF